MSEGNMRTLTFFILALVIVSMIEAVQAGAIVEDADSVQEVEMPSVPTELESSTIAPRTAVEYAQVILKSPLRISNELLNKTNETFPRTTVEYAQVILKNSLGLSEELLNTTSGVASRVIVEYSSKTAKVPLVFPKELLNNTTSPILTNIAIKNITGNSATINWDTDEFADSLVKYGVSGYTESKADSLFVKNHTINLTGLSPGTTYYFVVNSTDQSENSAESSEYSFTTSGALKIFDTGSPANPYPSIMGTHNGTITLNQTITVFKLYTYLCSGTGGHTEYARIWNNSGLDVNASWNGYVGDWHNISFDKTVVLLANETYFYEIRTGSYPQIHHTDNLSTPARFITCSEFIDANGKKYNNWIPAIRLE